MRSMERKAYAYLLVLVGVALGLAGPAAGDLEASFAVEGGHSMDAAPARRQMISWRSKLKLEDGVEPELTVDLELHRRILAGGSISPGALRPDRPACISTCPARGGSYTGRGCQSKYQCPG